MVDDNDEFKTINVLKLKLSKNDSNYYYLNYSGGGSNDYGYTLERSLNEISDQSVSFSCYEITLPGNGYIYTSGHTNSMFDERKKFIVRDDKAVEVKQPFKYVGVQTKLKFDLDIYSDTTTKTVVASLIKGTKATVLLNYSDNYYLIKTPFGLTGWIYMEEKFDTYFEDIFFNGD